MGLVCSCAEDRHNGGERSNTVENMMMGPSQKGIGCGNEVLCGSGREKLPIIKFEDHSRPYNGRLEDERGGPGHENEA
jgi:hypothetical protein